MNTPKPIWVPEDLKAAFEGSVVQAYTNPEIYHPIYTPLPWVIALYGRPGMEKLEVVRKLCATHGLLPSLTEVDVKIGCVTDVLNTIYCVMEASKSILEKQTTTPTIQHIIVINHADVLAYEPDSEKTLLACLDFKKKCEESGVILIGLFDRLPGESHGQTSNWVREAHNKFFSQFETNLYIECPNEEFRKSLFKYYIEDFTQHYNKTHEIPLLMSISDQDYDRFALISTFATPENILVFLKKVFSKIILTPIEDCCLSADYIEEFTNNRFGAPHICEYDTCDANNAFSTGCGKGPVLKKKKPIISKPEDVSNITGFNEENADLKRVLEKLEEKDGEKEEAEKKVIKKRKTKAKAKSKKINE